MTKDNDGFFVVPDTTQLPLIGHPDQWIEVKRELRNYDKKVMESAAFSAFRPGSEAAGTSQEWVPDLPKIDEAKALAWIVDWSLTDAKQKRVPFNRDGWRNLRPRVAALIIETLDAYTKALDEEADSDPTVLELTPQLSSVNGWDGVGATTSRPLSE